MKVIVEKNFWEMFPEATINILYVKGLDNKKYSEKQIYLKTLLDSASKKAEAYLVEDSFAENEIIKEWREGFTKFKTKKGARSSIEALLKRVSQGREFLPINPLVDLYNSISLSYGVPCGGEDIDKIVGDLHLGKAKGGEAFYPLGAAEDSPALPEELIYYDNKGAICRNFNWREAQRTMLTEETSNAILVIESINSKQRERAKQAMEELSSLVSDYFGITGRVYQLSSGQQVIDLS